MNAPWIPDTGKVIVNNTDRYSAMKNDIQDKMRAIHAPLLSEREKEDVFMSLEDDLDMMIRRAGMR